MNVDRAMRIAELALDFGKVDRVTRHQDGERLESNGTHVVMLGLLACEVASELDVGRVAQLVYVHDLAEAYAGDTNSFGISSKAYEEKKAREAAALDRIVIENKANPWLLGAIREYEARETLESQLVWYPDKACPKLCHTLNGGASLRSWGVTPDELFQTHRKQLDDLHEQYPARKFEVHLYSHGLNGSPEINGQRPNLTTLKKRRVANQWRLTLFWARCCESMEIGPGGAYRYRVKESADAWGCLYAGHCVIVAAPNPLWQGELAAIGPVEAKEDTLWYEGLSSRGALKGCGTLTMSLPEHARARWYKDRGLT